MSSIIMNKTNISTTTTVVESEMKANSLLSANSRCSSFITVNNAASFLSPYSNLSAPSTPATSIFTLIPAASTLTLATTAKQKLLNCLSLDGDGVACMSQLYVLREVINRMPNDLGLAMSRKPCEVFDIIAGVSLSAVIGVMFVHLELTIDQAIAEFSKLMDQTFSIHFLACFYHNRAQKLSKDFKFGAKKLEKNLQNLVQKYLGQSDALFCNTSSSDSSKCRLVVLATDASDFTAHAALTVFRSDETTYEYSNLETIWEVCQAAVANPKYFPPYPINNKPYADASHGMCNPLGVMMEEIKKVWGSSENGGNGGMGLKVNLLSLGSVEKKEYSMRDLFKTTRAVPKKVNKVVRQVRAIIDGMNAASAAAVSGTSPKSRSSRSTISSRHLSTISTSSSSSKPALGYNPSNLFRIVPSLPQSKFNAHYANARNPLRRLAHILECDPKNFKLRIEDAGKLKRGLVERISEDWCKSDVNGGVLRDVGEALVKGIQMRE